MLQSCSSVDLTVNYTPGTTIKIDGNYSDITVENNFIKKRMKNNQINSNLRTLTIDTPIHNFIKDAIKLELNNSSVHPAKNQKIIKAEIIDFSFIEGLGKNWNTSLEIKYQIYIQKKYCHEVLIRTTSNPKFYQSEAVISLVRKNILNFLSDEDIQKCLK